MALVTGNTVRMRRHGRPLYQSMVEQCLVDPNHLYDPKFQIFPDLTANGVDDVIEGTRGFLSMLDPAVDVLDIGASSQARTLETAYWVLQMAEEMGFHVAEHAIPGNRLFRILGQGKGKILEIPELALDPTRTPLMAALFAREGMVKIDWDQVDPTVKKLWDVARLLVDPTAGWGKNFFLYSQRIKAKILPGIRSVYDLYVEEFHRILELIKKALSETHDGKNIHTIFIGHEDYLAYFLHVSFMVHSIKPFEEIKFFIQNGFLMAEFRGKTIQMERM